MTSESSAPKTVRIVKSNNVVSQSDDDVQVMHQKLAEAQREAEKYRLQLLQKEQEAEKYRQKLQSLTKSGNWLCIVPLSRLACGVLRSDRSLAVISLSAIGSINHQLIFYVTFSVQCAKLPFNFNSCLPLVHFFLIQVGSCSNIYDW